MDIKKEIEIAIEKAISLREQGNVEEALEAYNKIAKLLEEEGDILNAANAYLEMGLLLNENGEDEKALEWHKKAFNSFNEQKDERTALVAIYLCVTLTNLGDHEEAINFGLQSLKIYETMKNEEGLAGMAEAYYALALAKTESNETQEEAIQYFHKALEINNKLKNKEAISSINNELGNIFLTLDKLEEAMIHFKKALDLYKKLDDIEGMASTFVNIAEVYEIKEDYRNAGFNFLKAAEQFIECNLPDLAEEFIARTDSLLSELPKSTRRTIRKKIDELNNKIK